MCEKVLEECRRLDVVQKEADMKLLRSRFVHLLTLPSRFPFSLPRRRLRSFIMCPQRQNDIWVEPKFRVKGH